MNTIDQIINTHTPGSLQQIIEGIRDSLQTAVPVAMTTGQEIGEAFGRGLLDALNALLPDVSGAIEAIVGVMAGAQDQAEQAGRGIGDAFANGLKTAVNAAQTASNNIAQTMSDLASSMQQAGSNGIAGLAQGLSQTAAAEAAMRNLATRLQNEVSSLIGTLQSLGETAVSSLENSLATADFSSLTNAIDTAVHSANDQLAGLQESASNAVSSMANEFSNGEIAAAAAAAAQSAIDATNQTLEIASPSRVFRRMGQQSVAGYVEPFEGRTIADKITKSLKAGTLGGFEGSPKLGGRPATQQVAAAGQSGNTYVFHIDMRGVTGMNPRDMERRFESVAQRVLDGNLRRADNRLR